MVKDRKTYSGLFDAVSEMEQDKSIKKEMGEANDSDVGLAQSFDRCKRLHQLMHDKVEQALSRNSLSPKMLSDYFSTPDNFTKEQWGLIEDQKEEVERQLHELVPVFETLTDEEAAQKKIAAAKKEFKPKVMQVKSRWIPMR